MCLFSAIKLAYHHYYRKTMWVKYYFCIFYLDTMTHQCWHLLHVLEAQLPLTRQQHYFISWPSKHLETAVFHLLNDSIHSGNVISLEWRVLNPSWLKVPTGTEWWSHYWIRHRIWAMKGQNLSMRLLISK